jgi:hypothetical protein
MLSLRTVGGTVAGSQNLRPWQPGQSGNPGGRPKKRVLDEVLIELLEKDGGKEASEIALTVLRKAKDGDLRACQFIAERTQGRPPQALQISGEDGGVLEIRNMTDQQLEQQIAKLLKEINLGK